MMCHLPQKQSYPILPCLRSRTRILKTLASFFKFVIHDTSMFLIACVWLRNNPMQTLCDKYFIYVKTWRLNHIVSTKFPIRANYMVLKERKKKSGQIDFLTD